MGAALAMRKKLEGITLQFTVRIHDKPIKAIIDTGAQLFLISNRETDRLRLRVSRNDGDQIVYGVAGNALQVLETILVYMTNGKETKQAIVYVVDGIKHDLILGLPWIREHAPIIHWNEISLEFKSGAKWLPDKEKKFKLLSTN